MAPELRKRKTVTETQKSNGTTKVEKTVTKTKRKAPEDASPVSLKKQKSVKKTVVEKPAKSAPKGKKQPVKEVEVVEEETLEVPDESESEAEEGKEVQALVTELDSEDEDVTTGDALFKPGQDVGEIPDVSKQVEQAAKGADGEPGVLYIGRIPHGFYEHEMRQYFEQFGPINKLRLSRNKKTGASKHFAFVEFAESSTAQIVAKTMDNYLLFGHILKCRVIPKEKVRDDLFKGANRRFKKVPWNKMAGHRLEKPHTESAWANKVSKEQGKRAKKAAKLKEIGYEFEAPEIKPVPAPAAPEAIEEAEEVKAIEAAPEEKPVETEVEVEVTEKEPEVEVKVKAKKVTKAKTTKAKGKKSKA